MFDYVYDYELRLQGTQCRELRLRFVTGATLN